MFQPFTSHLLDQSGYGFMNLRPLVDPWYSHYSPGETAVMRQAELLEKQKEAEGLNQGDDSLSPSEQAGQRKNQPGALGDGHVTVGYAPVALKVDPNDPVLRWGNEINQVAKQLGIPAQVVAAMIQIESGGNPGAVSPSGAVGLMQVMPGYHASRAAKYGQSLNTPIGQIYAGADYMKDLYNEIRPLVKDDHTAWGLVAGAYLTGDPRWWQNNNTSVDAHGTSAQMHMTSFYNALPRYQQAGEYLPVSAYTITGGQQYPMTQGYGQTGFARSSGMYRDNFHMGWDIGVPSGTKLYTPWPGEVVEAGWSNAGYGYHVLIRTNFGYVLLGHMSGMPPVKAGQTLNAGTLVGVSGSTGASTGAHVHIELRDHNGNHIDPGKYLYI